MTSYVETLALAWAEDDPLESWMLAAPDGRPISPDTLRQIVEDYLVDHEPFPDGTRVEVARRHGGGWDRAVIVDRPHHDEWTVEYDNGDRAYRDHSELRPSP